MSNSTNAALAWLHERGIGDDGHARKCVRVIARGAPYAGLTRA